MAKAAHGSPRLRKMASLAKTLNGMHHKADGGEVTDAMREKGLKDLGGQMRAAQAVSGRPRSLRDETEAGYISDKFRRN